MVSKTDLESRGESSRKSSAASGFRLLLGDVCETVSIHSKQSTCKQKIDSMFDDSRSVASQHLLNNPLQEEDENEEPRVPNCVQARIERMFSDVVISSEGKNGDKNESSSNEFAVGFLGALFLPNKITNLEGLQGPLHKLYSGADKAKKCTLNICPAGLRVQEIGTNEVKISPFSSITVWSAVKYVIDVVNNTSAFLPLITDPDNVDKRKLFRPLIGSRPNAKPEPMFVVVMKPKADFNNKSLECHGFLCRTSEDSIVIAATLYRNLVSHMTSKTRHSDENELNSKTSIDECRKEDGLLKRNGMSKRNRKKESNGINNKPARPPRKKRPAPQPNRNGGYCTPVDAVNQNKMPVPNISPQHENQNVEMDYSSIDYSTQQECCKIKNDGHKTDNPNFQNSGDVFTKVAIPRSRSFLNAGGITGFQGMNQRRTVMLSGSNGSPLGFSELFAEFRLQENLHSLDEILEVIINADGMSFNDLKPIYKEFLLKLAVTLTKDEMFNRSKSIMRKQRKRRNNKITNSNLRYFVDNKYKDIKNYPFPDDHKLKKIKSDSGINLLKLNSEESCEIMQQIRNSSSGYVSCSDCSYDSECCTCISAEPCYCSLGPNAKFQSCNNKKYNNTASNSSYDCDCDSDSCLDIDTKCYCKKITKQNINRCSENALSIKKSEEIAALFANANFIQKPNIANLNPNKSKRRNSSNSVQQDKPQLVRSWQSNVSLVDTLGYFP